MDDVFAVVVSSWRRLSVGSVTAESGRHGGLYAVQLRRVNVTKTNNVCAPRRRTTQTESVVRIFLDHKDCGDGGVGGGGDGEEWTPIARRAVLLWRRRLQHSTAPTIASENVAAGHVIRMDRPRLLGPGYSAGCSDCN